MRDTPSVLMILNYCFFFKVKYNDIRLKENCFIFFILEFHGYGREKNIIEIFFKQTVSRTKDCGATGQETREEWRRVRRFF
jgi:hypothetical protein